MAKRNKRRRDMVPDPTRDVTGAAAVAGELAAPAAVLTFQGEAFELAPRLGMMPLLKFAHLAKQDIDSNELDGLVAMYDLLRNVIADDDWQRFEEHATLVRADGDDLMEVVSQAIEAITARPTARPSDSSGGPATTRPSSADDSSSRVVRRLELEGRPSIALMVRQRQEVVSRASA
ncbi:hypothetical protein [Terrabacter terrigena]|uniref:Tail assembly chaperone n=1 Tax=Terrabacter terrigena TaxID=574718 RepID=A0ABW3MXL5_9MICO